MQTQIYFNTTNLSGSELLTEESNAESLQKRVLKFFQDRPKQGYIWSDLFEYFGGYEKVNESSLKRCMSVLASENKLWISKDYKLSIRKKKCYLHFLNWK